VLYVLSTMLSSGSTEVMEGISFLGCGLLWSAIVYYLLDLNPYLCLRVLIELLLLVVALDSTYYGWLFVGIIVLVCLSS